MSMWDTAVSSESTGSHLPFVTFQSFQETALDIGLTYSLDTQIYNTIPKLYMYMEKTQNASQKKRM